MYYYYGCSALKLQEKYMIRLPKAELPDSDHPVAEMGKKYLCTLPCYVRSGIFVHEVVVGVSSWTWRIYPNEPAIKTAGKPRQRRVNLGLKWVKRKSQRFTQNRYDREWVGFHILQLCCRGKGNQSVQTHFAR